MSFFIVRQDITKMQVDAIVNAANTGLKMGGGVCGAIFRAAGAAELAAACEKEAPIATGEAAVTPGFALPAAYVIHAAGPVYSVLHRNKCRELLRAAYLSSLQLAEENGCRSIAFPLISSGIYGYPKDEALQVARRSIEEFLAQHDMEVYLVVFDKSSFVLSEALLGSVADYLGEHYAGEDAGASLANAYSCDTRQLLEEEVAAIQAAASECPESQFEIPRYLPSFSGDFSDLADHLADLDEPFGDTLLKLIDAKGKTDVEVYKRANLDRKLFSKIRTGKGYTPKKRTILALAVALELTLCETNELLRRAGYALSHSSKFDVIVEYFLANQKYNIFEINEVLFQYDQPLLGS